MKVHFSVRKYLCLCAGFRLLGIFACVSAHAEAARKAFNPEEVKAAFVIHFCRFATWPEGTFVDPASPLKIGVWGDRTFSRELARAAAGEQIGSRSVEVVYVSGASELRGLHLLVVPATAQAQFEHLPALARKNLLLVGDAPDFLVAGGHIQFVRDSGRIVLRVNLEAVRESNLALSSRLLRLAKPGSGS